MVVGWTPTSLAMRRQLQCVASAGFSSRVLRTISASSSGVILRGRPERGRSSSSSSTPPASYRSSHCVTVGLDTPTSRQIADPDRPSAEQRTMLALSTTRCGVVRLFTNRSKRLRSPRRNRILRTGSPMRGIYRMYLLGKRFLLHYTRAWVGIQVPEHPLPQQRGLLSWLRSGAIRNRYSEMNRLVRRSLRGRFRTGRPWLQS